MRAGGPRLASEPGTGESRAGGPRPPRVEGPTPGASLTPAIGSAAAALPQRRLSRDTESPAPAGLGQAAGSPRRTFHIRKQPYKSRFRRTLPAPYMAIPAPGWGGWYRANLQPGARPPLGNGRTRKPRAAEEPGCCPGRWRRSLGEHPADPGVAAVFSQAELPLAPTPFAQLALLASPPPPRRSQAPAANGQRCRARGNLDVELSGCWQRARDGSCPFPENAISGISAACRDRPAPPAADESGGALPVAPDRDRPRLRVPPSRSGERGTDKQRAPGTTWPQRTRFQCTTDFSAMQSDSARDSALAALRLSPDTATALSCPPR